MHPGKVHQIKHSVSQETVKQSELKHIQRDKRCSHVQIIKKKKTRVTCAYLQVVSHSANVLTCQWYMPAYVTFLIKTIKKQLNQRIAKVLRQRRNQKFPTVFGVVQGLLGEAAPCWPTGGITANRKRGCGHLTMTLRF